MFTFPILSVYKVVDQGITDAAANGGFRVPYQGISPAVDGGPGVWLVGDEGVYLCSNGKLAKGQKPLVVYSDECHPVGNPDWYDYKRRHFGGDDGGEFIQAERLLPLFDQNRRCTHLRVQLSETQIEFSLITR